MCASTQMLQESFFVGAKIPKVKKLPTKFSNPSKTKNTPTFIFFFFFLKKNTPMPQKYKHSYISPLDLRKEKRKIK